ncbi:cysteine hydrolase family protein [Glonium stellatum]|uniref:Cysteine hydrolase family protein n=1 Tax=Glonium stellatum TaxID=574774 RepID=A0A8E2EZ16_9PEZI|nr:cysteine hydrolase family protein [Glonium stellatum]
MKVLLAHLLTLLTLATAQTINSTIPANQTFNFGKHYAVLNLDLIDGTVSGVATTSAGQAFINSTSKWINAVHNQSPKPLIIFTRIYFTTVQKPEIGLETPFGIAVAPLGNITETSAVSQIYSAFDVLDTDVVLQKTRYYAGAGNGLEEILRAQGIDTVILSGLRTSGVILSTVYRLFDLDYKIYVISNNTIEVGNDAALIQSAALNGIIPKLPADVITIEQALAALKRSGPAVW